MVAVTWLIAMSVRLLLTLVELQRRGEKESLEEQDEDGDRV